MDISMGPFITCTLGITFLTVYLYIILYKLDHPYIYGAKVIFAGIAVIFLRMCIPVNFPSPAPYIRGSSFCLWQIFSPRISAHPAVKSRTS